MQRTKLVFAVGVTVAALVLAACAAKEDPAAMVASGKAYMAKADYKAHK